MNEMIGVQIPDRNWKSRTKVLETLPLELSVSLRTLSSLRLLALGHPFDAFSRRLIRPLPSRPALPATLSLSNRWSRTMPSPSAPIFKRLPAALNIEN